MQEMNVGAWYKEKNGDGLYQVFGVAKHSLTWEWLVIYVHKSNEYLIAVPINTWKETMEYVDIDSTK